MYSVYIYMYACIIYIYIYIYITVDHAGNLNRKLPDSTHSIPGQGQVATCGIFAHVSAQKGLFSLELWVLAALSSLLGWEIHWKSWEQ